MGEWTSRHLGDVIELRRGFDLPTRLRETGPYPVLSSGSTAGWHSEGPVKGPGFVVGRATNLGEPTWSEGDFWPLNTTLYAADFKGNHPKFLFHLFELLDLSGFDSGSVQPMLNRNYISGVEVSVPDFRTQEAITQVLGALDGKMAANERIARSARRLGDQLFVRSATGAMRAPTKIGELSDRSAIEFSDGYRTKRAEHGQPGLRILRAGDVRDSYVYPDGDDYVSQNYSRQIGSKASIAGDIVLTTKGTVGRVAVVAEGVERVVYSPQLCFFRVKDDGQIDPGYLGAWFRSSELQQQAATLMYKSDMAPYISLRDVRSLVIPLPPIEEQRRIGEVQRNLFAAFDASRVENERLARTRDELLPLLMSGKVRVTDAAAIASEAM